MNRFGLFLFALTLLNGHLAAQTDIECSALLSPAVSATSCTTAFTASEFVTIDYANVGVTTLTNGAIITIDVTLDGTSILTEFDILGVAFATGQVNQYTTMATVDLSAPGAHVFVVSCTAAGDINTANDSQTLPYSDQPQGFGYFENFDSLPSNAGSANMTVFDVPPGWENAADDFASLVGNVEADWGPNSGPTGSVGGGPVGDNTTGNGNYMYIEDSQNQDGAIELRTPCFGTSGAIGSPTLLFANFSDQTSVSPFDNLLRLDVINMTTGGTVTMNVDTFSGAGVAAWRKLQVDLSAFVPDTIRVQFRINNNNGNFNDDEAIDDVSFIDQLNPIGQPAQPGDAVFNINNAININFDAPGTFKNGPFFATATIGGTVNFQMLGEPNQPIILLTGPLNPRVASFGIVGQFDIGTGLQTNGLPSGLMLIGDGNGSSFFNSLFVLNAAGQADIGFTVPILPLGVLGSFQCAILRSGAVGVALSNAVELTIQ
ncbi:MAG: hypothetical protein ACI97A_001594 [Planctomycetota bacterium]|jgi:hypothetical protein